VQTSALLIRLCGSYLIEKPCTEDHLHTVVDDKHTLQIHWLSVLHDLGAEYLDKVGIAEADCQRGEGTTHQQPIIHSWVCRQLHRIQSFLQICRKLERILRAVFPR